MKIWDRIKGMFDMFPEETAVRIVFGREDARATLKENGLIILTSGTKVYEFSGGSTVWHIFPSMARCSNPVETKLCQIEMYIKHHGSPWPTAHLKEKNEANG